MIPMQPPSDSLIRGISVIFFALAAFYLAGIVFGPTSEDSTLSASLTVNSFVDISVNQTTLSFGSLDPATSNNPATENPVGISNTANSNTQVDIYLNNTNMTSGANFIPYYNLSVAASSGAGNATNFNYTTYLNGTSADTGFVENLAVSSTTGLYFWHDVPAGQAAGAYTANVTIHSVATGNAP